MGILIFLFLAWTWEVFYFSMSLTIKAAMKNGEFRDMLLQSNPYAEKFSEKNIGTSQAIINNPLK